MQGAEFIQTKWPLSKIEQEYGVSSDFIYKLRRQRGLKLFHLGSKPFINPQHLEALMEEEPDGAFMNDRRRKKE